MTEFKTRKEIFEQLKPIISNTSGIDDISMETDLFYDLDLDSLDKVEIVMECEKEFHISIYDEEVDKVTTVEQLVDLILSKPSLI